MPRKKMSEEERKRRKRERDQDRVGFSIFMGKETPRWQRLRKAAGLTHIEFASLLLDRFEATNGPKSAWTTDLETLTPQKAETEYVCIKDKTSNGQIEPYAFGTIKDDEDEPNDQKNHVFESNCDLETKFTPEMETDTKQFDTRNPEKDDCGSQNKQIKFTQKSSDNSLNDPQEENITETFYLNHEAMDYTITENINQKSHDSFYNGTAPNASVIKTEPNDSPEEYDSYISEVDNDHDNLSEFSESDYYNDNSEDLDWTPAFKQKNSSTRSKAIIKKKSVSEVDSSDNVKNEVKSTQHRGEKNDVSSKRPHVRRAKSWREKYVDHAFGEFKCPNCQTTIETKFKLREHVESEHDNFMCPLCEKCFKSKAECDIHKQDHYVFNKTDSLMGEVHCEKCDLKFTSKHIFFIHMSLKTHMYLSRDRKFCVHCEIFVPSQEFKKHWSSEHSYLLTECPICKEKIPMEKNLKDGKYRGMERHLFDKHNIHNYKCPFCDYAGSYFSGLNVHIKAKHHMKKVLSCKSCSFSGTKGQLRFHFKMHHFGKPFVCKKCGDSFDSYKMLRQHHQKHAILIPCEYCGKEMTRKNYKQHIRIHNGYKPYFCEHCGVQFAQKNSLNWHLSSKHSDLNEQK